MIPLPDLLYPRPTATVDDRLLEELLEMSFLGGEPSADLGDALESVELGASPWQPDLFADGLFLDDLVERCFALLLGGRRFPLHRRYLRRVLSRPPVAVATIHFRQEILAELESDPALRERAEALYELLFNLLAMFKSPGRGLAGEHAAFRLEILRLIQRVVESMVADFADCASGLRRLHEVGLEIRAGHEHRVLEALLDHEERLAELSLRVRVGADGRIRHLTVDDVDENAGNVFHRGPWRRGWDRLTLRLRGFDVDPREVVNRLIVAVYEEIAPALRTLLQLIGPLQVYLGTLAFAESARGAGLAVCRPQLVAAEAGLALERLFNPLLLHDDEPPPVPCDIAPRHPFPTVVVTGPNSGGKTRMLQAVGIAQILGQAGLYVPALRARVPRAPGPVRVAHRARDGGPDGGSPGRGAGAHPAPVRGDPAGVDDPARRAVLGDEPVGGGGDRVAGAGPAARPAADRLHHHPLPGLRAPAGGGAAVPGGGVPARGVDGGFRADVPVHAGGGADVAGGEHGAAHGGDLRRAGGPAGATVRHRTAGAARGGFFRGRGGVGDSWLG